MLELQSCAGLVNDSALYSIKEQVNRENVNAVAEIAAELQRERERNAELMKRIKLLEAQMQESNRKASPVDEQDSQTDSAEKSLSKFKRQKIEQNSHQLGDDGIIIKPKMASNKNLVSWMSMDETLFLPSDEMKDGNIIVDHDDSDDREDEDHYSKEDNSRNDHRDEHNDDKQSRQRCLGSEQTVPDACETRKKGKKVCGGVDKEKKIEVFASGQENCQILNGSTPKSPKAPFCPREVRRMLESDALLLKDAHSHTIRKIIVFASLGIRRGCEDVYELDFNHFSIINKGKPYVSPNEPGEHVLYENPRLRRKIFYPNRENPTLCPVQILEEEKAMRPSDPICPSSLFLCIKYGGRTRNLPQNEYVRQRMGKNKLKSFGPSICQMAMLAHIRNGSFFFKALGITLLFMAGFPGDLIRRETKYRSLDLLQKYFRQDEDAEGEELFLSHPIDIPSPCSSWQTTTKRNTTKSKGRKQTNTLSKCNSFPKPSFRKSSPPGMLNVNQIGLMNYTLPQSMQLEASINTLQAMNLSFKFSRHGNSYHNQTPYHILTPQPTNIFMPMTYWPPPNVFPYPASYGYQSWPPSSNHISIHPHPYLNHPSSSPFNPNILQGTGKGDPEEVATDLGSSSSTREQKEPLLLSGE